MSDVAFLVSKSLARALLCSGFARFGVEGNMRRKRCRGLNNENEQRYALGFPVITIWPRYGTYSGNKSDDIQASVSLADLQLSVQLS